MALEPNDLAKLDELLAAIREYDDPRRATAEWKQVYRLLQKTDLPSGRVGGIVGMRNVDGLAELLEGLGAPGGEPAPDADAPDPETCRRALKAFRKRLAVTKLDDESQLGRGPLSKGSHADYAAIEPPAEWPGEVWQELCRQGKLRDIGHGFYELGKG